MRKYQKKYFFFLFISIVLLNLLYSQEQDIKFKHITTAQGLSSNIVYDLIQDSRGFMWFATQDGLNRFDGSNFKIFKYNPLDANSIAVNWCQSLYEDKFGKLWIGTLYGGLNLYDPNTEKFVAFKHDPGNPYSISNDVVLSICEDDSGNLWLGTWDGLNKLVRNNVINPDPEKTQFIRYKKNIADPNSLSDNRIWELFSDTFGIIWIGTENGGLNRFDPKTGIFKRYQHDPNNPNSLSHNKITVIYEDPNRKGRIFWIGVQGGGLNKFDSQKEFFFPESSEPAKSAVSDSPWVLSILRDKNGVLWVGTWEGLRKYTNSNKEKFPRTFNLYRKNLSNPNNLRSNYIKTLYEDRTGILWIGTIGGGVSRISSSKKNFRNHLSIFPGYKSLPGIISIYEDDNKTCWLGTGTGLYRLDRRKKTITRYGHNPNDANSLSSNEIYSIYEEADCEDKTLWVLCRDGGLDKLVLKKDPDTGVTVRRILPNPLDSVSTACKLGLSLLRDKKGKFWIGANEGLFQLDQASGKVTQYLADHQEPNSLIRDRVDKIYQSPYDDENILWLGTSNGLYRIDPENNGLVHYAPDAATENSLSDFRVISLLADGPTHGKILWVGTWSGGLNKLDIEKGTFRHFMETDGLSSNTIYSMLQDDKGCLWLGTKNGLTKFDPQTETFNTFVLEDGVHFTNFYQGAAFKNNKTGEFLFGGSGIVAFFPDSIKGYVNFPPIVLSDFKVFNKPFKLDTSITTIKEIRLSYKQNFFSIGFAALEYSQPQKHQYTYMLEGIDKDWVYCGNRKFASYTNIRSGNYTFRVRCTNTAGVWNGDGVSVKILISPPIWETNWFRFLIVIGLCGLFILFYYIRVSRLRKEKDAQQAFSKQLIETQEKERKRIAGGLHDSLG
ncbi:MAG: hypothetical protein GXO75_18735, partial [Calditrichaeota bacterium]|nr:hypothetical protein [Calditrichota bacterium]